MLMALATLAPCRGTVLNYLWSSKPGVAPVVKKGIHWSFGGQTGYASVVLS